MPPSVTFEVATVMAAVKNRRYSGGWVGGQERGSGEESDLKREGKREVVVS